LRLIAASNPANAGVSTPSCGRFRRVVPLASVVLQHLHRHVGTSIAPIGSDGPPRKMR